ncbi:Carbonic anhydrase 2 [compost metagenome]
MQTIKDPVKRSNRLVELNAIEGAANVMSTSIVQNAWASGQDLSVHAWAYSLETGLIKDLQVSASGADDISTVFKMQAHK